MRKHLIQKLNDNGVPANQIVQISGHKNINSINNYSKLNPGQSKQISSICQAEANKSISSRIPSMLSGNIFNAPVSFHFETKTSLNHTQTAMWSPKRPYHEGNDEESPVEPIKKWRRLQVLDSDSE